MQVTRVFDLLSSLKLYHSEKSILVSKENSQWTHYTTDDFIKNVNELSLGLLKLGVQRSEAVAIMSPSRPEWNFVDFAVMQIGAVSLPLYPTLSESDLKYILNDSQAKIIFVANQELYEKVKNIAKDVPSLVHFFSYDPIAEIKNWRELKIGGDKSEISQLEEIKNKITSDDLLTLIYTSGTTGVPKGVMLTHHNLVSNFQSSSPVVPKQATIALSFLPLSHIFERMIVYLYLSQGVCVHYAESLDKISDNLKEIKPHIFTTVPRLLEKVYDRILAKGAEQRGIKRGLFYWALNLGLRYEYDGANGWWYELQLKIANILIFKKWREALGGRILAICSGGAALQVRLARVFCAARIPVMEGYGLTETSPVIAVNRLEKGMKRFGTVGPAIEGVQVKIAEDGEILVKGPNIMKGYYKRPEATAEVIDMDGWFHTGDIGIIVEDKFLKITDRKKEVFKTAGGKYIAPQVIENKFKESKFIEQIVVIGENQRFPAALIVPAFAYLKDWCQTKNIEYTTNEKMIIRPEIIARIQKEIDHYNQGFGHWEQIKKFSLLAREFSIEEGEMTPKLSLKRKVIVEKYKHIINAIYS